MDYVWAYNIFEGFLWLGFSCIFFIPAMKRTEKNRLFCILGGLAFVFASLSEFYEAHTGAWWKPWWLILWKGSFAPISVLMYLWYRKIQKTKRMHEKPSESSEKI